MTQLYFPTAYLQLNSDDISRRAIDRRETSSCCSRR